MLARFEQIMEQAVEGSLRRVFPAALQPVQLAKAAARAMEEAQVVGLRGPEVPNSYRVRLAPADLQRFADYRGTLARELRSYLIDYAADRGLRPIGEPRVELVEDPAVRQGTVRAEAHFVDLSPARQDEVDQALEGTRRLRLADLAGARSPAAAAAMPPPEAAAFELTEPSGARFALEPSTGMLRIGRAADNDIALDNQRVSRYHAQLRWVESSWLLYDLDSTNGTFLDGERVFPSQPRVVRPGSVLRLGDHDLHVVQSRAD